MQKRALAVALIFSVAAHSAFSSDMRPIRVTFQDIETADRTEIGAVAISGSGKHFAAIHKSGLLETWDEDSVQSMKRIPFAGNSRSITFWTERTIATTWAQFHSGKSGVIVWDFGSGSPTAKLPVALIGDPSRVVKVETQSGPLLVSGSSIPIGGWTIRVGENQRHSGSVEVWSETDMKKFKTSDAGKQLGYGVELFHLEKEWSQYDGGTNDIAVDTDASVFAVAGGSWKEGLISLFSIATGKCVWRKSFDDFPTTGCCFCDHGKRLAISSSEWPEIRGRNRSDQDVIRMLDCDSGNELFQWRSNQKFISAIASSEGLDLLVTGGDDGTICFWQPDDGTIVMRIPSQVGNLTAMSFSTVGGKLMVGGKTGKVRVYTVERVGSDR